MTFPYLHVGEAILLTRHGNQAIGVQGFAREFRFSAYPYNPDPFGAWNPPWDGPAPEFRVEVDINMLALHTVAVNLEDIGDIWTPQSTLPQPRLPDGG